MGEQSSLHPEFVMCEAMENVVTCRLLLIKYALSSPADLRAGDYCLFGSVIIDLPHLAAALFREPPRPIQPANDSPVSVPLIDRDESKEHDSA